MKCLRPHERSTCTSTIPTLCGDARRRALRGRLTYPRVLEWAGRSVPGVVVVAAAAVCAFACVRVRACVRGRVCVCVHVCARARTGFHSQNCSGHLSESRWILPPSARHCGRGGVAAGSHCRGIFVMSCTRAVARIESNRIESAESPRVLRSLYVDAPRAPLACVRHVRHCHACVTCVTGMRAPRASLAHCCR